MKRVLLLLTVGLVCLCLFVGCSCQHEWLDATCTVPKTCSACGETEGTPMGHNWTDATCDAPKTCSVCSETEGEPLAHSWIAATCEEAEYCTACGQTQAPALGHNWQEATCLAPKTCAVCSATEGDLGDHVWQEATCLAPQTCSTCAQTVGELGDHAWKDATCTDPKCCGTCGETTGSANGHAFESATCTAPKTCSVCSATEGEALGHNLSDWTVVSQSYEDKTATRVQTCKRCKEEVNREDYTLSDDELKALYKKDCVKIGYKDLLRNPGEYKDTQIKVSGTVFQVVSEASSAIYYSVYFVKSNGNLYCVLIDNYGSGSRILKGDNITIYGTFSELYTYETVRGDSNTIPKIYAEFYD